MKKNKEILREFLNFLVLEVQTEKNVDLAIVNDANEKRFKKIKVFYAGYQNPIG